MIDNFQAKFEYPPRPYHDNEPMPRINISSAEELANYLYYHFINTEEYYYVEIRRSPYKRGYPCDYFMDYNTHEDVTVYWDWEENVIWWWAPEGVTIAYKYTADAPESMLTELVYSRPQCSYADFSNWYIGDSFSDGSFDSDLLGGNFTDAVVSDITGYFQMHDIPDGFNTLQFTDGDIYLRTSKTNIDLSGMDNTGVNTWDITVDIDDESVEDVYIDAHNITDKFGVIGADGDNTDYVVHLNLQGASLEYDENYSGTLPPICNLDVDMTDVDFSNATSFNSMFRGCNIVSYSDNTTGNHTGIANIEDVTGMFWESTGITGAMVTKLLGGATSITNASMMFDDMVFADITNISLPIMDNCTDFDYMFANATVSGSNTIDFTFLDNWDGHFASGASFDHMFYNNDPNITVIYPNWSGTFDANGTFTPTV